MLSFVLTDTKNQSHELCNPAYISINMEENVPADDLSVVFPTRFDDTEFVSIRVFDGKSLIFKGLIDEQQRIFTSDKLYTKLVARSMAAALLDNECKPLSYTNPSTSVIFEKHLKPFGITEYKGDNRILKESLNVNKGKTHWQVFYTFCVNAFEVIPRISADGKAYFSGLESDRKLRFSNENGIRYNSLKENYKRCKLLSDVFVKYTEDNPYEIDIENKNAKQSQIRRERFFDASGSYASAVIADRMIENSIRNSYELTLICPSRLLDVLGAEAEISDSFIGEQKNLRICGLFYRLSPNGEYTTVTLKRGA